jgi:methionyl-tRNA synthetase
MQLARLGNKYLADAEPWKQIKTDPDRVAAIMHTALQIAAGLAILSEPFLPFTSKKLIQMLNIEPLQLTWETIRQKKELIPSEHHLNEAQLLFQKIEDAQMDQQREKLKLNDTKTSEKTSTIPPIKPITSYEDFASLELKVAEITAAKKIKKTKKLMEIHLQVGVEFRKVVSGIAQDFEPSELIGKKVTLLSNLSPRTLKGVESKGMILLGENEEGGFVFIQPEDTSVASGSSIE